MTPDSVALWMLEKIRNESCIYQDDVVDFLVKNNQEVLLVENADGNKVLGRNVLTSFRKLTDSTVVWVKPDRHWRFRVDEDEPGRDARG